MSIVINLSKFWRYLIFSLCTFVTALYLSSCASLGYEPEKSVLRSYESSPNYSIEREGFVNIDQDAVDDKINRPKDFSMIWNRLVNRYEGSPSSMLPVIEPNFDSLVENDASLKVIWFGHSSFLLYIEGVTVLVDPVFGAAAPLDFMAKRFQSAVTDVTKLPSIDYVLISHDHYDHLEMDTVQHFANLETIFVVPLGVSSHLKGWGIGENNIIEADWWQTHKLGDISFTATPSQHYSGREGFGRNKTLWASWVIKSKNRNAYFSGDTGYHQHFEAIGREYGPFDVAFIETGQYHPHWKETHLFPEQGIKAFYDLKAKSYFPIHWGVFKLAPHAWDESIKSITSLAKLHDIAIFTPEIGRVTDLLSKPEENSWWENQ